MIVALAAWLVGALVFRALVPGKASPLRPAAALPRVSVIVPARDEERNLPALLASLAALDPPAHEIIVVDDHSSDHTAVIARAAGVKVVTPPPLPEGWRGKCWACQAGAEAASGDWLLFTDADTVHGRDSLALAASAMVGADLVTVVPTHINVRVWEKLQAVFHMLLLVATSGTRGFAIGQYLLFRREAYERVGRHAAVRSWVAEDLAFAARLEELGGTRRVVVSPGMLSVRMYPEGFAAFWRGWTRNFRDGLPAAGWRGGLAVTLVIAWLLGAPLALLVDASWAGALATLVAVVTIARRQPLLGSFRAAAALAYPLFVLVFCAVSVVSALAAIARRPVTWRGRRFQQRA